LLRREPALHTALARSTYADILERVGRTRFVVMVTLCDGISYCSYG
jgi:hypothetical protein